MGTGKCICDKGYSGIECSECSRGFIKNNYYCSECPGSMGGKKTSCNGNGNCIISQNKAICKCNKGYKGKTCFEFNSNNCLHLDNCNSNGKCIDNSCFCNSNFLGEKCNISIVNYNKMYNTSLSLFSEKDNIVKKDIQTIEKQGAGASIGISITIVFMFMGCILGGIFIFKNKNNIKKNLQCRPLL